MSDRTKLVFEPSLNQRKLGTAKRIRGLLQLVSLTVFIPTHLAAQPPTDSHGFLQLEHVIDLKLPGITSSETRTATVTFVRSRDKNSPAFGNLVSAGVVTENFKSVAGSPGCTVTTTAATVYTFDSGWVAEGVTTTPGAAFSLRFRTTPYFSSTPPATITATYVTSCDGVSLTTTQTGPAPVEEGGVDFFGVVPVFKGKFEKATSEAGVTETMTIQGEVDLNDLLTVSPLTQRPTIPAGSQVDAGRHVLTHMDLNNRVTLLGQPAAGVQVTLQSSRGTDDTIHQPVAPTNAAGETVADIETRLQPGTSTVTSNSATVDTGDPLVVDWLPADYVSPFLVTCYIISDESDFVNTPLISNVGGLPPANQYHRGFLQDVRVQGSGRTLDGTIIGYAGHNTYQVRQCALTATGRCATEGTTIAVDPHVIPLRSSVTVAILGGRVAEDTGSAVIGYHIDDYMGPNRARCNALGRRSSNIRFDSY